ncbi:Os08g0198250 [Oryza sativa Japonica Group]|uniref:Os08g0198250 protein n=1 Tax=Oryza sativa subsp. japonica TaxID=39947 RepID=A0A0N7KPF0_ORYSJ|nr:Os08g0198250 [Oryza sativa Japonica Group]
MFCCARFPRMDTDCCFVVATIARHNVPSCTVTDAFSGFSATAARPPPPPNSSVKSGIACSVCFLLDVHMRSFKIRVTKLIFALPESTVMRELAAKATVLLPTLTKSRTTV